MNRFGIYFLAYISLFTLKYLIFFTVNINDVVYSSTLGICWTSRHQRVVVFTFFYRWSKWYFPSCQLYQRNTCPGNEYRRRIRRNWNRRFLRASTNFVLPKCHQWSACTGSTFTICYSFNFLFIDIRLLGTQFLRTAVGHSIFILFGTIVWLLNNKYLNI